MARSTAFFSSDIFNPILLCDLHFTKYVKVCIDMSNPQYCNWLNLHFKYFILFNFIPLFFVQKGCKCKAYSNYFLCLPSMGNIFRLILLWCTESYSVIYHFRSKTTFYICTVMQHDHCFKFSGIYSKIKLILIQNLFLQSQIKLFQNKMSTDRSSALHRTVRETH